MTALHRLWRSLSTLPTPRAVRSEWLDLLGPEYPLVASLLRPTDDLARTFPRPDGRPPYEVTRHGPDDVVGVCRETQERVVLTIDDLRVHAFDVATCLDRLCEAFAVNPNGPQAPSRDGVHFLGTVGPARPAYFVLVTGRRPDDCADTEAWVRDHVAAPAVLFVPTRSCWSDRVLEAWARAGHEVFALEGTIGVLPTGTWEANFRPGSRASAPTRGPLTQNQLEALTVLKDKLAYDSDRRVPTSEIVRLATGSGGSFETFRTSLKELKKLGLVTSKPGRDGGYWMTPEGRDRAASL